MNQFGPVRVDLLTSGLRISGLNQDPDQSRRLSDVLNGPDGQFVMSEVALRDLTGRMLERCRTMVVEKRSVLVVVPHESDEQIARYRARRFGIATPATQPVSTLIAVPPFLVTGSVAFRDPKEAQRGVSGLPPFFPMLDASLTIEGAPIERAAVVLVNRNHVVALGLQDAPPAPPSAEPLDARLSGLLRSDSSPRLTNPPS